MPWLAFTYTYTQTVKNGDAAVYTGVLKFQCNKLDGFENLPTYKIFYNNRKLGRHAEQYGEKNRIAEENQQLAEKEGDRKQLQKEKEQRKAERN